MRKDRVKEIENISVKIEGLRKTISQLSQVITEVNTELLRVLSKIEQEATNDRHK